MPGTATNCADQGLVRDTLSPVPGTATDQGLVRDTLSLVPGTATDPIDDGLVLGDLVDAVQSLEGGGPVEGLAADWGPGGVVLQL